MRPIARRRLELVPVGGVSVPLLHDLGRALDAVLATASTLAPPLPVDPAWTDADRAELSSTAVVDALLDRAEPGGRAPEGEDGGRWMLGVADAWLAAPGVGRVFGEATVGGPCAVVGLRALAPEPWDELLFRQRLVAEAVHELGHLAGLGHCADAQCVMYPSADIADTDRKGHRFCARCLAESFHPPGEAQP